MYLLHNISPLRLNSNYNTIEEIQRSTGPISFDGVYTSVMSYTNELQGRDIVLFPMGAFVGKDNLFDLGQPLSYFCTWNEVKWLAQRLNARIGYHSWSHPDLTTLSDDEAYREICAPQVSGVKFDLFAYPHGRVNDRIADLVRAAGYDDAYCAGPHGNGSRYQRKRSYLNW